MKFLYVPKRSFNTRTSFFFDLERRKISISVKNGHEVYERKNGEYLCGFRVEGENDYEIDLDSIEESTKTLPQGIVEFAPIDSEPEQLSVKILKKYGPENESNPVVEFPDWNDISRSAFDKELAVATKLSDFDVLIHTWKDQLTEIILQTLNLLIYLNDEYSRINSQTPPLASPISIRSFKTSVLTNSILYIECASNFLLNVADQINDSCDGSPKKIASLEDEEIKFIREQSGFLRLEQKLPVATEKLNKLIGAKLTVEKSNHSWGKFKSIKTKRDSITHTKIKAYRDHIDTSIDYMISSVKITDGSLLDCIEVIIWVNKLLDKTFDTLKVKKGFHDSSFNDFNISSLLKVVSSINDLPYEKNLKKYDLNQPSW